MKIKYSILIVFIILLGFMSIQTISFLTEGRSYYFKRTESTDLSNESFGNVQLDDNIYSPSFIKQYGVPLDRDNNDLYDYYHWEGGLETASIISGKEKGKIVRLIIEEEDMKRNSLKTAKGIILGNTKHGVFSLYGSNYYKRVEQGVDIIGYVDHKLGVTLEFWLVEGEKVAMIRLDDANIE
ncbi:hypothetical protein [Metabacillus fastidiosus]|uniref:hypothetical protein n=1 Tax=Metabacillus fastidiosus TaxID=1458 RepID=UPI002DC0287F|nr:hypothetical protein [Metabacillus fastidiosus]MEC2076244.1 hypothetical protein [Metabacillus fastidiosus]